MESDHRVRLGCGCGKAGGGSSESTAQADPVVTGIEGETGAAQ